MNQQLLQYITFARDRKVSDVDIRANLVAAGWDGGQVDRALGAGDDAMLMPPPPPGVTMPAGSSPAAAAPIAVIQQRTTRGLEYTIMFLSLGVTAIALGIVLHNLVDSLFGFQSAFDGVVSYASSALLVGLPIFALLFIRLKRAELREPQIRQDASRRHSVQLTLIIAFLWGLLRIVTYIYSLINGASATSYDGSNISSSAGNFLHLLVTLAIAGGIFVYYWLDEHRKVGV
jgi:hypothetical protein